MQYIMGYYDHDQFRQYLHTYPLLNTLLNYRNYCEQQDEEQLVPMDLSNIHLPSIDSVINLPYINYFFYSYM